MNTQQNTDEQTNTFTPVDSVSSLVADMRAAGFSAECSGGGVVTDMTDDEYAAFMTARGYVRE